MLTGKDGFNPTHNPITNILIMDIPTTQCAVALMKPSLEFGTGLHWFGLDTGKPQARCPAILLNVPGLDRRLYQ